MDSDNVPFWATLASVLLIAQACLSVLFTTTDASQQQKNTTTHKDSFTNHLLTLPMGASYLSLLFWLAIILH